MTALSNAYHQQETNRARRLALAMHKPEALWENQSEEFQIRSDEEIALDITRGMALWKKELEGRPKKRPKS